MTIGISLHLGLNSIDQRHYGTEGVLAGAENDARAMQRLAVPLGYRTAILLTAEARADNILTAIRDAARQLTAGDTFLLTYAGHGAQVPDTDNEETDKLDETWCVYDRMVVDDELHALWCLFKPGVRIVVVSDSCHSGTAARPLGTRRLPWLFQASTYNRNRTLYDNTRRATPRRDRSVAMTGVITLSACRDNQLSADGASNGMFTEKLLQAWDQGRFVGSYVELIDAVRSLMPRPEEQTPGYDTEGAGADLLSDQPFAITRLSATCPQSHHLSQDPQPVTTLPLKENTMQTYIDNGNWEEVAAILSQEEEQKRGGVTFMAKVIAANAQAAQEAKRGVNAQESLLTNRGGSVFRVFWWGFHVQVSHEDLVNALRATDPNGDIVRFLRLVIPRDYQYWIDIITPFVVVTANVLRSLDRGRGVYISMSWFAAGLFAPTTV